MLLTFAVLYGFAWYAWDDLGRLCDEMQHDDELDALWSEEA